MFINWHNQHTPIIGQCQLSAQFVQQMRVRFVNSIIAQFYWSLWMAFHSNSKVALSRLEGNQNPANKFVESSLIAGAFHNCVQQLAIDRQCQTTMTHCKHRAATNILTKIRNFRDIRTCQKEPKSDQKWT